MEFQPPAGTAVVDITLEAETEEAFDAAVEELDLVHTGEISNTRTAELTAYSYRFASSFKDGVRLSLRGPKREMKMVPADA